MSKRPLLPLPTLIAGFDVLLFDQLSKWYVMGPLDLPNQGRVAVWPPYLEFRFARNEGVNFGLLAGFDMRWVLVLVALAISATVLVWIRKEGASLSAKIAAGLLIGGAMGNVVDRVWYGWVVDFLNMSCCGIVNPYAFNIADVAVFIGAIWLVLATGRPEGKKHP